MEKNDLHMEYTLMDTIDILHEFVDIHIYQISDVCILNPLQGRNEI